MKVVALSMIAVAGAVSLRKSNSTYTVNDKILINGAEVAAGSALDDMVGECHHAGKEATSFSVCGCGVKVEASLLTECQPYSKYTKTIGACNCAQEGCTSADLTTGYTEKFEWTAASYAVVKCPAGR